MPRHSQLRLWTPIANAVEAYRRRMISDDRAIYEHTWRLIHIEEALAVTLVACLASRLRDLWAANQVRLAELNNLRQMVTGIATVSEDDEEPALSSCLSGSIDAWIEVLIRYGKSDVHPDCCFCRAVGTYLSEEIEEGLAFAEPWQRVAPVPSQFREKRLSRVARLRAINVFRNKLAHVPIPHRVLGELHAGLRTEVLRLLCDDEQLLKKHHTADLTTTSWHSPLKGRIANRRGFVSGSDYGQHEQTSPPSADGTFFEWRDGDNTGELLSWRASPFVELDEEFKVGLLFRVEDLTSDPQQDQFSADYHRFAAEFEPVQRRSIQRVIIAPWLPDNRPNTVVAPTTSPVSSASFDGAADSAADHSDDINVIESNGSMVVDTAVPPAHDVAPERPARLPVPEELNTYQLRSLAEEAYRKRETELAFKYFTELSRRGDRQKYNDVAKLKHGVATWQYAEHSDEIAMDLGRRQTLLRDAVDILDQAASHSDVFYSAKALYQKSKALWHLWRLTNQDQHLEQARSCANRAAMIAYEPSYLSWHERLDKEWAQLKQR